MAWGTWTAWGTAMNNKTSNTGAWSNSLTVGAETLVVISGVCDNLSANTPTVSFTKPGGETRSWRVAYHASASATAAAGDIGFVAFIRTSVAWSAFTVVGTFSAAVAAKYVTGQYITGGQTGDIDGNTGYNWNSTSGGFSSTTGAQYSAGSMQLWHVTHQSNSVPPTWTLNGAGTAISSGNTTGSSAATNVGMVLGYNIKATTSGTSVFWSGAGSTSGGILLSFPDVPPAAVTQGAYRWYREGGESGAPALAAQDTAYDANITNTLTNLVLRVRLQSTNIANLPATDDWQLQWEKNANGTWTNVGVGTATVAAFQAPSLNNGFPTTNRLGAGTGTFTAGKQDTTYGSVADLGWTGNNYTELLYSLVLKIADLATGDVLQFRVLRNGVTTDMTYTATPTINVTKTLQRVSEGPRPVGPNLLTGTDSTFESGMGGWWNPGSGVGMSVSTARAAQGTKSLLTVWDGLGGTPRSTLGVTLASGATYKYSAMVYVPSGSPDALLTVWWGAVNEYSGEAVVTQKDAWVRAELTFVAMPTNELWLRNADPFSAGQVWMDQVSVVQVSPLPLAADWFTGADSPTGLYNRGTNIGRYTTVGNKQWEQGASDWAISGNRVPGTNSGSCVVDVGTTDVSVRCDFHVGPALAADQGLAIRFAGNNDSLRVGIVAGGTWGIKQVVAANDNVLAMGVGVPAINTTYQMRVECVGPLITLYVNEAYVCTATLTDASVLTATKFGLNAGQSGYWWDNFSITPPTGVIAADNFDRADTTGPTGLGVTSGGQTWQYLWGGGYIVGNQGTVGHTDGVPVDGGAAAIECGTPDITMTVGRPVMAVESGFVARWTDANNYLWFNNSGARVKIGGVETYLGSYEAAGFASGDTHTLVLSGPSIKLYRNGVLALSATTALVTGTKHGIAVFSTGSSANRFENLTIAAPPTPVTRSVSWEVEPIRASASRSTTWDTKRLVGYQAYVADDFNGPDGVANIANYTTSARSTPDGAEPWTSSAGPSAAWGISNNRAYKPFAGAGQGSYLTVNIGVSDCTMECDYTTGATLNGSGPAPRYIDPNHAVRIGAGSGTWAIWDRTAGNVATGGTAAPNTTYRMRIECSGLNVKVYANNVLQVQGTLVDATLATATSYGFWSEDTADHFFDNFSVSPLGSAPPIRASWNTLAAVRADSNLLSANASSMETDVSAWTSGGTVAATVASDTAHVYAGTKALKITWNGGSLVAVNTPVTGLTVGQRYTATAWVWVTAGSADVELMIDQFYNVGPLVTTKGSWVQTSHTFTATATSHTLGFYPEPQPASGTMWVDDVRLFLANPNLLSEADSKFEASIASNAELVTDPANYWMAMPFASGWTWNATGGQLTHAALTGNGQADLVRSTTNPILRPAATPDDFIVRVTVRLLTMQKIVIGLHVGKTANDAAQGQFWKPNDARTFKNEWLLPAGTSTIELPVNAASAPTATYPYVAPYISPIYDTIYPMSILTLDSIDLLAPGVAGWQSQGAPGPTIVASSTQKYQGAGSMKVTWAGGGGVPYVRANPATTGFVIGQRYTVSAWVYLEAGCPPIGVGCESAQNGPTTSVTGSWQQVSHTWIATATSHRPVINQGSSTTPGVCYVDQVVVTETASVTRSTLWHVLPSNPKGIPGLVGWYSADDSGTVTPGTMTSWKDLSGWNNHGVATGTPQWTATGGEAGGKGVTFSGANQYFTLPNLLSGAASGEIFATIKSTDMSSDQAHWKFGPSGGQNHYPYSDGNIYDDFGSSVRYGPITPSANRNLSTVWRRLNIWSAANDWAMSLDEQSQSTSGTNTVAWNTAPKLGSIGALGATLRYGAVLIFNRKLTAPERTKAIAWLTAFPAGGTAVSVTATRATTWHVKKQIGGPGDVLVVFDGIGLTNGSTLNNGSGAFADTKVASVANTPVISTTDTQAPSIVCQVNSPDIVTWLTGTARTGGRVRFYLKVDGATHSNTNTAVTFVGEGGTNLKVSFASLSPFQVRIEDSTAATVFNAAVTGWTYNTWVRAEVAWDELAAQVYIYDASTGELRGATGWVLGDYDHDGAYGYDTMSLGPTTVYAVAQNFNFAHLVLTGGLYTQPIGPYPGWIDRTTTWNVAPPPIRITQTKATTWRVLRTLAAPATRVASWDVQGAAASASGTLSLSASGVARAPVGATGSLSLSGAGAGQARFAASASLVFAATTDNKVRALVASATGALVLTGVGTAVGNIPVLASRATSWRTLMLVKSLSGDAFEGFDTGIPAYVTKSGGVTWDPAGSLITGGGDAFWLDDPMWHRGNFTFSVDVRFPTINANRELTNVSFWMDTTGGTNNRTGYMFRLDTDGVMGFNYVLTGSHYPVPAAWGVGPLASKDVTYRVLLIGNASSGEVQVTVTDLNAQTVVASGSYVMNPGNRFGTFGQKHDGAGSAGGQRWDNLTLRDPSVVRPTTWHTLARAWKPVPVAIDDFTGADSTTGLWSGGAPPSYYSNRSTQYGTLPWIGSGTTSWGIENNKVYKTLAVPSFVFVDTSLADGEMRTDFTTASDLTNDDGLTVRRFDSSNYIRISSAGGYWTIQKIVAGVTTNVAQTAGIVVSPSTTYNLRVVLAGTQVDLYVNDVFTIGGAVAEHLTNSRHGFTGVPLDLRWDNYSFGPVGWADPTLRPEYSVIRSTTWDVIRQITQVSTSKATTWNTRTQVTKTVGGPAFSPSMITGLGIWFDASQLPGADGTTVSPWPNLANGSLPGTMEPDGDLPVVRANALNGQKVVRFTVSQGRMRIASTGVDDEWTVVYVGRMWSTSGLGRIVTAEYPGGGNLLVGFWNGYEDVAYDNGFMSPDTRATFSTNWKLYSGDGTVSPSQLTRFFSDGTLLGSATTGQGWGGTFAISGYDSVTMAETCDCEVAEVALYNRKLSDVERDQVEDHLRAKWLGAGAGGGGWKVFTSVSLNRATTWNVAPGSIPVSTSRATTWHAKAPVTDPVATTWNVRTPVSTAKVASWDVQGATASASGTLVLSATGTVVSRITATGLLSLSSTGGARAPGAATGSLSLAGSGAAKTAGVAAGSLSLSGAGVARAATAASAALSLSAGVTAAARAVATAALVLTGVGTAKPRITAARATTWHAAASVTDPISTTWHVQTTVPTVRVTSWRVLLQVVWAPTTGATERMLNDTPPASFLTGVYTLGAQFVVNADGYVTHVRYYHIDDCPPETEHTVTIWDATGTVKLATTTFTGGGG